MKKPPIPKKSVLMELPNEEDNGNSDDQITLQEDEEDLTLKNNEEDIFHNPKDDSKNNSEKLDKPKKSKKIRSEAQLEALRKGREKKLKKIWDEQERMKQAYFEERKKELEVNSNPNPQATVATPQQTTQPTPQQHDFEKFIDNYKKFKDLESFILQRAETKMGRTSQSRTEPPDNTNNNNKKNESKANAALAYQLPNRRKGGFM